MSIQTFKLYMTVGVGSYNHGQIELSKFKPKEDDAGADMFAARFLREVYIEAEVPEFDLATLEIDCLEKAIQREKADSQVRQSILLDRISKLKAIGHDQE